MIIKCIIDGNLILFSLLWLFDNGLATNNLTKFLNRSTIHGKLTRFKPKTILIATLVPLSTNACQNIPFQQVTKNVQDGRCFPWRLHFNRHVIPKRLHGIFSLLRHAFLNHHFTKLERQLIGKIMQQASASFNKFFLIITNLQYICIKNYQMYVKLGKWLYIRPFPRIIMQYCYIIIRNIPRNCRISSISLFYIFWKGTYKTLANLIYSFCKLGRNLRFIIL